MHLQFTPEFIEKFWQRVDKNGPEFVGDEPNLGPCWLWTGGLSPKGYGICQVKGYKDVPDVGTRAHRQAFYIAFGWILPTLYGRTRHDIAHKCDVRNCVNPRHLVQMSHEENIADRNAKGRQDHGPNAPLVQPIPKRGMRRGEGASRAKLTEADVRAIRAMYVRGKRGCGVSAIAKQYGVHDFAIEMIVKRKSWAHIK